MTSNNKIALACTECRIKNYQTNKSNSQTKRVNLKKYCRKCNKSTLHKEEV